MVYKKMLLRELTWSEELDFQVWKFVRDYSEYNRIRMHHRRQDVSGIWHDEIMWFDRDGFWSFMKAIYKVGDIVADYSWPTKY